MDPLRRLNDTSGAQYAVINPTTFSTVHSTTSSTVHGTSGVSRSMSGADSSIRTTIDSSTIEWNGHVDSSSMFGTLQRFALSSCGISLHSNTEYGGLVTFDKEIEKHLSPALTGSPARHIRGLTRDIIRSQVGRRALAESLGIPVDSLAAEALFGDPSEYPAGVVLDFERSIAALSSTISNGDFPTDIIPLPSPAVKSERRRFVDDSALDEAGADRLDDAEGQPGEGDGTSGGGVLPPEAGDETAHTSITGEESREFIKIVFGRFEAAYGSPRVGMVVIRRLIGALEAPTDLDVVGYV